MPADDHPISEIPMQARANYASRMAHALAVLVDSAAAPALPYIHRDDAANAGQVILDVRNEICETLQKSGACDADSAACAVSDCGLDAARDATWRAELEAARQHRPGDDRFMDVSEYHVHVFDAVGWIAYSIKCLTDD